MFELFVSATILTTFFLVVTGPSLIAMYRWRFGGGKLLNDRLGDGKTSPLHERR